MPDNEEMVISCDPVLYIIYHPNYMSLLHGHDALFWNVCSLQIEDVLSENPTQVIPLPNCTSFSCISMGMIRELVEELER